MGARGDKIMSVTAGSYEIKRYNCNGSQVDFDFDWRIFGDEDLVVKLYDKDDNETTLALTTHYTASKAGANWKYGGKIRTVETHPLGYRLTIERAVARKQPADYRAHDNFPAEVHEAVLDRAILIIQEQQDLIDRAIKMPAADASSIDMTLPAKDKRKNRYQYFDVNGKPTAAGQSLLGSVTVTDFAETLLDDGDAETMINTIFPNLLLGARGVKIGSDTRSTAGNQVITGVDFKSSVIIFLAVDHTFANQNWSVGFDNGTIHKCIRNLSNDTETDLQSANSISIARDGGNLLIGYISALGSDGFTITWELTGACQVDFMYLAFP